MHKVEIEYAKEPGEEEAQRITHNFGNGDSATEFAKRQVKIPQVTGVKVNGKPWK